MGNIVNIFLELWNQDSTAGNIVNGLLQLWDQDSTAFLSSVVIMIVGIVANCVAVLPKRWERVLGNIILAALFDVFTCLYYRNWALSVIVIVLSVIWVLICTALSSNKEIISRKKLDKLIRNFTARADYSEPLCIFGGDLDFFGSVEKKPSSQQQGQRKDNHSIQHNQQYCQLRDMRFQHIHILSIKPKGDQDRETRIRIGFLKKEFGDALTIKFVQTDNCATCSERSSCLSCDVCQGCSKNKGDDRNTISECEKLSRYYQYRCYNPDTKLRGRVAKEKKTGATIVAIVTTDKPGKSYILKEYSSNTKECTIYQNIWDVWWKKCMEDPDFIASCVEEYENYIK